MTTLRCIATFLLILGLSSNAASESGSSKGTVYYGGNLGFLSYNVGSQKFSTKAVYGRYGRFFNKYLAAEGRIALRFGNDSYTENSDNAFDPETDVELDYIYGAFGRAEIEIAQSAQFYLLLGYAQTRSTASIDDGTSTSNSESSAAGGFGFNFGSVGTTRFNIEYTSYLDLDGLSLDGVALGFVNYF